MERKKMPNLRNGSKGDSNPGSLDCESGVDTYILLVNHGPGYDINFIKLHPGGWYRQAIHPGP